MYLYIYTNIHLDVYILSSGLQELSVSQQEQLQQRAAYLRQQRDKLHALKKEQQRTKQNSSAGEAPPTLTAAPTKSPVNTVQVSLPERWRKEEKRVKGQVDAADSCRHRKGQLRTMIQFDSGFILCPS